MFFLQARHHGGTQQSVTRLVIHGTVTPCGRGWARHVASDFHTTDRQASAHYVIDPFEAVQCLAENTIGYHAPPNSGSLGFELCDPQNGDPGRWQDAEHEAMLRRAAALVRARADAWEIPLVKLSPADLLAGKKGVCGHADVSAAWHQSDHTDPGGAFPWSHFMQLVKDGDGMQLSDSVPVGETYAGDFKHDAYPVEFVLIGSFAEAKRARLAAAEIRLDIAEVKTALRETKEELDEIKALLLGNTPAG